MSRRCTARAKSTGERCRRRPHPGANVCVIHGAGAPQVQRTARERLAELVLPAITTLHDALASGDLAAALKAARMVLDRCGYPASSKLAVEEVTQPDSSYMRWLETNEVRAIWDLISTAEARKAAGEPPRRAAAPRPVRDREYP